MALNVSLLAWHDCRVEKDDVVLLEDESLFWKVNTTVFARIVSCINYYTQNVLGVFKGSPTILATSLRGTR